MAELRFDPRAPRRSTTLCPSTDFLRCVSVMMEDTGSAPTFGSALRRLDGRDAAVVDIAVATVGAAEEEDDDDVIATPEGTGIFVSRSGGAIVVTGTDVSVISTAFLFIFS